MLSLTGVHTHIGQYHILQGVDLTVPRGGLTVLLGRNGAGKTTALRTIMGLWHASRGALLFDGEDITRAATPDISCAGIAYVPENMGIFSDLPVRENLLLAARAGAPDAARLEWIFGFFPALKKFCVKVGEPLGESEAFSNCAVFGNAETDALIDKIILAKTFRAASMVLGRPPGHLQAAGRQVGRGLAQPPGMD